MGTICAPQHENINTDHFERKYVCPFLQEISLIYLRSIDDIFFIRNGATERIKNCLNDVNKKHNSIKSEYNISQTSITLFDTEILAQNKNIFTKIYRKSTDRQNFFHVDSEHPKSLKNSILYGQALRNKRICTKSNYFN